MDAVGFSTLPGGVDLVRRGGVYVSIPTLCDDGDIQAGIAASQAKGVRRVFSTMSDVGCAAPLARIARLLGDGAARPPPLTEYALQDAADAHRQIQSGHTRGKIVLKVADIGSGT